MAKQAKSVEPQVADRCNRWMSDMGLDYKLDLSGCRRMVFSFSGAVRLGSER